MHVRQQNISSVVCTCRDTAKYARQYVVQYIMCLLCSRLFRENIALNSKNSNSNNNNIHSNNKEISTTTMVATSTVATPTNTTTTTPIKTIATTTTSATTIKIHLTKIYLKVYNSTYPFNYQRIGF